MTHPTATLLLLREPFLMLFFGVWKHGELMQEIFPSQSTHFIFGGKAGGRTQQ